jgi:NifU-like protein involved in Fe-S cluster formation
VHIYCLVSSGGLLVGILPDLSAGVQVIDHYDNPRNVGKLDSKDPSVGTGLVGAPACGDVMKVQIKVRDI